MEFGCSWIASKGKHAKLRLAQQPRMSLPSPGERPSLASSRTIKPHVFRGLNWLRKDNAVLLSQTRITGFSCAYEGFEPASIEYFNVIDVDSNLGIDN